MSEKVIKFPGVQSIELPDEQIDRNEATKRVEEIFDECKAANYKKFFLVAIADEEDAYGQDLFMRMVNVDELEILWMLEQIKYHMFNN